MKKINPLQSMLDNKDEVKLKSILILISTLALPSIFEQIMVTMVQYIDTAMVGSLGASATAAIGITASTTWLFNGILNAVSIGFSVQVAQKIGAKDFGEAKHIVAQGLKSIVIFGVFMSALALSISNFLPTWLGASADIHTQAVQYFMIIAAALPFNMCVMMVGAIIRCSGDTKTPMILNLFINIINVTLNFLFIYPTRELEVFGIKIIMWGADLGVIGAALGSAISLFIISFLFVLVLFKKSSYIKLSKDTSFKYSAKTLKTVVRLGTPVALERVTISAAQILITGIISSIGTVAIAANHLAVTAEAVSYLPAFGIATAGTTMIGQAIGANRQDLAFRFAKLINFIGIIIMTIAGILLYIFSTPLMSIFTADPEVIALGSEVLKIVAYAQPFFAMSIAISGCLRGAGDTKAPFVITLITMWGVRIVFSYLLVSSLGLVGVWIAMALELAVRGIFFAYRLYSKKWLKGSV